MLKQNIDALKLMKAMHLLHYELGNRFSLLDVICLLYINEHEGCGARDIGEYLYNDRVFRKSSFNLPLIRLTDNLLIQRHENTKAAISQREQRVTYSLTAEGKKLLRRSKYK